MGFCRKLEIGTLDDGIDWTGFLKYGQQSGLSVNGPRSLSVLIYLAKSTVDAFRHVNVIARGPPGTISAFLSLDGDGLSWADGLAEFTSDAPLLPSGIPPTR